MSHGKIFLVLKYFWDNFRPFLSISCPDKCSGFQATSISLNGANGRWLCFLLWQGSHALAFSKLLQQKPKIEAPRNVNVTWIEKKMAISPYFHFHFCVSHVENLNLAPPLQELWAKEPCLPEIWPILLFFFPRGWRDTILPGLTSPSQKFSKST